jgi:uncharacterized membrane protein
MSQAPMTPRGDRELGRWVGTALATGTLLAMATVAVGVVLTLAGGGSGGAGEGHRGDLFSQITAGTPASLVAVGLLLLALTPVAQLVAAIIVFVRRGERRYVLIASVVLGLLLVGIATATIFSQAVGG